MRFRVSNAHEWNPVGKLALSDRIRAAKLTEELVKEILVELRRRRSGVDEANAALARASDLLDKAMKEGA